MRQYCKAYQLKELRAYPGWTEQQPEGGSALTDETVCYIWDDFTVVLSPIQDKAPLFDQVTPAWQEFCQSALHFEIPDDLRATSQEEVDASPPSH